LLSFILPPTSNRKLVTRKPFIKRYLISRDLPHH
jgi:hypothetical protein